MLFGEKCNFKHIDEECTEDNCNVFNCEKRHPRICKFMKEHGRCKFTTYCKYNHKKCTDVFDNAKKLADMEKQLANLQKKNNYAYEKETSEKFTIIEEKVETILKVFREKDIVGSFNPKSGI